MSRSQKLIVPQTYAALRRAVEATVFAGRRKIERAWVETYHETGRLINEHLLEHRGRADYGAKVLALLAADTGISKRTLHECAQFQRCFPIVRHGAQLGWAHYRALCQLEDGVKRNLLLGEAIKLKLTCTQVIERVRALNALDVAPRAEEAPLMGSAPPRPLIPRRGTPGVCKVIVVDGAPVADLGFAVYRDLGGTCFQAGDFVRVATSGIGLAKDATKADLFTYRAEVLKVVDGDTLWVKVYLEPERWVKQKLRLRELDCPEMDTPEGKAAKLFVEALLTESKGVIICTTKPDKYDRYLADTFLTAGDSSTGSGQADEIYLNNELLRHGHAVRKGGGYTPADWE